MTVKVAGANKLRRELKRAGLDMEDLREAHDRAARMVAADSRATAPRRTGALAGSLRGAGTKGRASVRAGYARIPYAGPIHWGWPARNIAAQPWILQTAERTEPAWYGIYLQAVQAILDGVEGA